MKPMAFLKKVVSETLVKVLVTILVPVVCVRFIPYLRIHVYQWSVILYDFLCGKIPIPVWAIIISSLIVLVCLVGIVCILIKIYWNRSYKEYNEDIFDGIKWRWSYDVIDRIVDLYSFCAEPNCDMQLKESVITVGYDQYSLRFHCDLCNHDVWFDNKSYENVKSEKIRLIQRNLRNGEWKQRIEKMNHNAL
jgi:hypothetical protein